MKKIFQIYFCLLTTMFFYNNNFAQTKQLQESETANFKTLKGLVNFIHKKSYSVSKRNILFDKYILFDYVLNDTSKERIDNRVALFDGLFSKFQHFIDSAGLNNLDALPIRFFKDDPQYKPFTEELKEVGPNTFAFFNKNSPSLPLGLILFDEKTHKIVSWIMIDQGGYKYFLTFNML